MQRTDNDLLYTVFADGANKYRLYPSLDSETMPLYMDERGAYPFVPFEELKERMLLLYNIEIPSFEEFRKGLATRGSGDRYTDMQSVIVREVRNEDIGLARTRFSVSFIREKLATTKGSLSNIYSLESIYRRVLDGSPSTNLLAFKVSGYSMTEVQGMFRKHFPSLSQLIFQWIPNFEEVEFDEYDARTNRYRALIERVITL